MVFGKLEVHRRNAFFIPALHWSLVTVEAAT
jgi:hypothetical protein